MFQIETAKAAAELSTRLAMPDFGARVLLTTYCNVLGVAVPSGIAPAPVSEPTPALALPPPAAEFEPEVELEREPASTPEPEPEPEPEPPPAAPPVAAPAPVSPSRRADRWLTENDPARALGTDRSLVLRAIGRLGVRRQGSLYRRDGGTPPK
jgi:hypothetical protein